MIGKAYAPGALVTAYSLRALKTRHDLVCMVTDDVPEETRAQLRLVYDRVVEVPYLARRSRSCTSLRQAEYYGAWIDRGFTKYNCLDPAALGAAYDRVALVDADLVFLVNSDSLLGLRAPAACFSIPWSQTVLRNLRGVPDPYVGKRGPELAHGARVRAETILEALRSPTFVGGGAISVLEPDAAMYRKFVDLISAGEVYGAGFRSTSGADEMAIAELYAREGVDWTHIHQRYCAIPWKKAWVSRDVRAWHYLGRKPWDMEPDEWPDLADWFRLADRLVAAHPGLRELFRPTAAATPLDADLAQLRLARDLRDLVLSAAKANGRAERAAWALADEVLGPWVQALANAGSPGPGAWARVYRPSEAGEAFNQELADSFLVKGVVSSRPKASRLLDEVLGLVAKRVGTLPRPSGASPACDAGEVSYGSHFKAPAGEHLRRLLAAGGGCGPAVAVALRYAAALDESPLCVPGAHAERLHAAAGVRHEGFASPLDSRLAGLPGGTFCSLFPDVDHPSLPSKGNFFDVFVTGGLSPGNWFINPPAAAGVVARAVARVVEVLEAGADRTTVFLLLPSWTAPDTLAALRDCVYLVAERAGAARCEGRDGEPLAPVPSVYAVLSNEPTAEADLALLLEDLIPR
jgi:hypothetical protein